MTDAELCKHLTDALEIARAKFHGLAAATKHPDCSIEAMGKLLQAGNRAAVSALKKSKYWECPLKDTSKYMVEA